MASNDYEYESIGLETVDDDTQKNLSLENTKSTINLFEKPYQLIYTDKKKLLQLNKDVLTQLSQIETAMNVIGVCGLYRTGKSYLINCIANKKKGFGLGNTTKSETKGIWIWCRNNPKQSDQVMVLLDTEGLDDPEKGDPDHDNKICCLTLLMSSTLLVNVKGLFDYGTLDKLAFIASLPNMVKVLDEEADEEKNAKTIQVAAPHLIICIRDVFLKPLKYGKSQTPDEYLEDKLKLVDETTVCDRNLKFNKIKKSIEDIFPNRKCFTIAQPAIGKDLQKIETLDESSLSKAFVEDMKALQSYVYDTKPKYICNAIKKPLDGSDLASLIISLVKSLNEGSSLNCQDVYIQAAAQRNKRVIKRVMSNFKKEMKNGDQLKNKDKLLVVFLKAFHTTLSKYREDSFLIIEDGYEDKLMKAMTAHFDTMKDELNTRCMMEGTNTLSTMYDELIKRYRSRYVTTEMGYKNYKADMEELKNTFFKNMKEYDKDI